VAHVADAKTLTCNFGTGVSRTGEEVVRAITEVMGVTPRIEVDQARLRPSERPVLCADITRATEVLGWVPTTAFEEGLRAATKGALPDDGRL
jgi:nucleoside-diphosphate-sugar epimerase